MQVGAVTLDDAWWSEEWTDEQWAYDDWMSEFQSWDYEQSDNAQDVATGWTNRVSDPF